MWFLTVVVCLAHLEHCWCVCQLALRGHSAICTVAATEDGREDNLLWWHCSQILLLRQIICKERKQGGTFRGQKRHQALCISNDSSFPLSWKNTLRNMLVRKGKAATHMGNEVGGWMAWMAEYICVIQGNIPQHHTAHQWQGSDSEDKSTSKVHGILVYFSWILSATEQGGLQAESIRSASCGCCWSGSSHRNKSLPPFFPFFWSREEVRLGDNHHCCCWTAARGCLILHWSGMRSSAPASTCPMVCQQKDEQLHIHQ